MTSRFAILTIALGLFAQLSAAQFNSGSTGADGALDLSSCVTAICEVQLPESGVLNYTTVSIPSGKTLSFLRNSRNTPVTLLAQGTVSIAGTLSVSAPQIVDYSLPGPGGFLGSDPGRNGFGPGGGLASGPRAGNWVGPLNLVPLIGGSGGAGVCVTFYGCHKGAGGGGAIVVASSTSIAVTSSGSVLAKGGADFHNYSGSGSGGAIRLVATTINVAGQLNALSNLQSNNLGGQGIIRIEATSLTFTGSSAPLATSAPINPVVVSPALPRLSIVSVGGYSVPAYSGARYDLIDLTLPNQLTDPVNIVVSGENIPTGTQVQIGIANGSPNGTTTPCNLAGTFASSSCTGTISNLNRTGGTYLLATAAFDPPASIASLNPTGTNHVAKIMLESTYGGPSRYKFVRNDGTEIQATILPKEFLQEFGL